MIYKNTIYENVKRYADQKGMSIREVERTAGLENGTIGKWRGTTKSPRLESVMGVAKALEVDIRDLIEEEA